MKEFDYKEAGYRLVDQAKTDETTGLHLLAAAYAIVMRLSQKYRDPETAADIQDVVAIMDRRSESQPNWAGRTEAKKLAKGLIAVSRHRMNRGIQARLTAGAGLEAKERFMQCEQSRLQSARTMDCLLLLEAVIEMDKVLACEDPREAALIFWHRIFLNAPKYLMALEEENIDAENEELMDKYRSMIWDLIQPHANAKNPAN